MRYNLTEQHQDFIREHWAVFKGNAKADANLRQKIYLVYNEVFNDSKRPSGCGACFRNVVDGLLKAYQKYNA